MMYLVSLQAQYYISYPILLHPFHPSLKGQAYHDIQPREITKPPSLPRVVSSCFLVICWKVECKVGVDWNGPSVIISALASRDVGSIPGHTGFLSRIPIS